MKASSKELLQIKGIGTILSKRMVDEGLDTFAKIVAAGVDGLQRIKGINPRAINSILEQATKLAESVSLDKTKISELKLGITGLREKIQTLTASSSERFQGELTHKTGRKLTKGLVKILDSLDGIEQKLPKRLKRAGKGILKAEQCLTALVESDINELRKGLGKTRKALKRVLK
jgi:uncharacterized protein YoxC